MFCPHCGKEYTEPANFCSQCGTSLVAPPSPRKPLTRSRTNRKIAGVCAGFAEYLNVDPALVRILWATAVTFGGSGLIAYILAWIIMPQEPLSILSPATAPGVSRQAAPSR